MSETENKQRGSMGEMARRTSIFSSEETFEEPHRERINMFLKSTIVEYTMSLIILGNLGLIIAETDIRASQPDEDFPQWMNVTSWSVLGLFVVELGLRMFVARSSFFMDRWNTFDFCVIITDFSFSLAADIFGELLPVSLLRVLRLAKLTRISQVFRQFPELRLMMAGLVGAARAIAWGTVLIVLTLLIVSVLAVQIIHPLNQELEKDGVYENSGCDRCADAYSSVFNSSLTFWQQIIAGDSWGLTTIPIVSKYPSSGIYFLGVFLIMGLALHNLILGVVVDAAMQSRKALESEMAMKHSIRRLNGQQNLLAMCSSMDKDDSGLLTKDELLNGYDNSESFRRCMDDLDVQKGDLEVVWLLMDSDRSGEVDFNEFVAQIFNMRNSESQFMLTYIKYYITQIKDRILEEMQVVEKELIKVERLEEANQEMHKQEMQAHEDYNKQTSGDSLGKDKLNPVQNEMDNTVPSKEPKQQEVWGPLIADLMNELRQQQVSVMARLEAIDAKMEMSAAEQIHRARSSFWSLPAPCQDVTPYQKPIRVVQTPATSTAPSREQTLLSTPDLQNGRLNASSQATFTSQSRPAPNQSVGRA